MTTMHLSPEDDVELRNLFAKYCLYLDLEDVERWVALFTPDAQYHVYGRTFEGHDGLRRMVTGAPGGLHLGGPPVLLPDGPDRVNALQNLLFVERGSAPSRSAVYEDELVRTPEGWRISSRRCRFVVPDGLADRPAE